MIDQSHPLPAAIKVPAVTLGFWIIKILATTLGETAGDTVSMSWDMGYLVGTAIFGAALLVLVMIQIRAAHFRPWLYWATIIASTTAGTTLADFATRSLGIGYTGGSALLLGLVLRTIPPLPENVATPAKPLPCRQQRPTDVGDQQTALPVPPKWTYPPDGDPKRPE